MNFDYREEYFSGLTSNWNRVSYSYISKLIDGAIKEKHGMKILDLGCGTGTYFFDLRNKNNEVFGIDFSSTAINAAKDKGYVELVQGSITELPYPENYFDFIFCTEVLEHVLDYKKGIEEINRVLKPNGRLLLTTTTYYTSIFQVDRKSIFNFKILWRYVMGYFNESVRNEFIREFLFDKMGGHYHGFISPNLKKDFENGGFVVVHSKNVFIQAPLHPFDPRELKILLNNRKLSFKWVILQIFRLIIISGNKFFSYVGVFPNNVVINARKVG